eukprot:gene1057-544_t
MDLDMYPGMYEGADAAGALAYDEFGLPIRRASVAAPR